jgi:hypothetical protein
MRILMFIKNKELCQNFLSWISDMKETKTISGMSHLVRSCNIFLRNVGIHLLRLNSVTDSVLTSKKI